MDRTSFKDKSTTAGQSTEVCDLLTGKYQPNQPYALPHMYTIPVAWEYVVEEIQGGDYANAAMVIDRKFVSILACECGKEIKRFPNGERRA